MKIAFTNICRCASCLTIKSIKISAYQALRAAYWECRTETKLTAVSTCNYQWCFRGLPKHCISYCFHPAYFFILYLFKLLGAAFSALSVLFLQGLSNWGSRHSEPPKEWWLLEIICQLKFHCRTHCTVFIDFFFFPTLFLKWGEQTELILSQREGRSWHKIKWWALAFLLSFREWERWGFSPWLPGYVLLLNIGCLPSAEAFSLM